MTTLFNSIPNKSEWTAVIVPSQTTPILLSHRELLHQVLKFQIRLANIGILPTDAVAMAFPNTIEFIVAFLATTFQRAISVPLNPAYKQDEFEFHLEELNVAVILLPIGATAQHGEAVRAARMCGCAIAEMHWNGEEVVLQIVEGNLKGRSLPGLESPKENDIAMFIHTSGTTGRPKAVALTHKNLCSAIKNVAATCKLTPMDRTLLVMPLFHIHGLLAGFLAPLMSRGSLIMPPSFSAAEFWKDFVTHKANWYTAIPAIHQILLKSSLPNPLPNIRFIRSCSSPLAPAVHNQLQALLKAPVLEAYEMTEASHQITSNPLPPAQQKAGSVGIAQGVNLFIVDDASNSLSYGKIGEVCLLGPTVTSGFKVKPDVITPPSKTSYFRTGDQGYVDEDGYLFLTGRIEECINKGGELISPLEIDNLLLQHPDILDAVTFPIEDELYGQNVAVAVVLRKGSKLSEELLLGWFAGRAAKFKIPKKVYFTSKIPKTATGTVQRCAVAKAMTANERGDAGRSSFGFGFSEIEREGRVEKPTGFLALVRYFGTGRFQRRK